MKLSLNEDWLATLIGLAIVAIVASGLIGPGPQNVTVRAEPGSGDGETILVIENARVTGRIGEQTVTVEGADQSLWFACRDGVISAVTLDELGTLAAPLPIELPINAALTLYNQCEQPASITYRTDAAIRFPLFNVFGR